MHSEIVFLFVALVIGGIVALNWYSKRAPSPREEEWWNAIK